MSGGSFWDRRRTRVAAEEQAAKAATEDALSKERAAQLEALEDDAALAELGLPDPATLTSGDDFSAFMQAGVPEKFRRVALRQLWRSNPVLANVDGLNEYDDDYRAQALGQVVKTAYQVGKGMTAHVEEMQRQAEAAIAEAESDAASDPETETDASHEPVALSESAEPEISADDTTQNNDQAVSAPQEDEAIAEVPAPRRMQFRFEEAHT